MPAKAIADFEKASTESNAAIALKTFLHRAGYSATLIRRTRAGEAELHRAVSDVWIVIDGSGTLVTNGTLSGARQTEPGELRGKGISAGMARHVAKGDLIEIPANTPHWVSAVDAGGIVYLVVKIKAVANGNPPQAQ